MQEYDPSPSLSSTPLRISVVMCTFNGARYLQEQMDSILRQTYPIEEVIVQDDGSTDETFSLLEQYAKRDGRVKISHNESGLHGVNGNFFSAMARTKGEYIAISDQDDIWEPDKLRLQAEAIGDSLLCSGFSVPFSTDGYPVRVDMRKPTTHLLRNTYLCNLPGHTLLFHRSLLELIRGGERLPLYYDTQLVMNAAAAESIVFVDKVLVHFRRHSAAATATLPVGDGLISRGTLDYVWVSLFHHRFLQGEVRKRFSVIKPMLEKMPFNTPSLRDGIYMSRLQLRRDPIAFVKKVVFFVRHSHFIFYTEERRPLIRLLRAAFFVYSCGYYYRAHLPRHKQK